MLHLALYKMALTRSISPAPRYAGRARLFTKAVMMTARKGVLRRMRLACSYTMAEVGLGHLIAQNPASAQRGAWRGAGFEANTQGWSTLRAAKGLLVSTSARQGTHGNSYVSAQGAQMDAAEAIAQLKSAHDVGQRLSDAATHSGAQSLRSHDANTADTKAGNNANSVAAFISLIDPTQQGKLSGSMNGTLNGQAASFDPAGHRLNPEQTNTPVPQFAQAVAVLDTPASASFASDAGVVQHAGQHLSHVAQGDVQLSAAHTASQVSGQTTSFYTHSGGMQIKAANGPVSLRAHTDTLQLLANQDIQIISVNDEITVQAQSKIELIGGNSGITLDGGNITFTTPGTWAAKGGFKALQGGGRGGAARVALPDSRVKFYDEQIRAVNESTGLPIADLPYKIETHSGDVIYGRTDENGKTERIATIDAENIKVTWGVEPTKPKQGENA